MRILATLVTAAALGAASAAAAQSSTASNPGGETSLGPGFFATGSGGVGSGAVGSPINTSPASSVGLFGPGGLWATAKPVASSPSGVDGVQLVDAPATTNGGANGSATAPTATSRSNLGVVGPRRFFTP